MWVIVVTCVVLLLGVALVILWCINRPRVSSRAKSQVRRTGAVMILRNYNAEGGFFWQLYNVLNLLYVCQERGFTPVVLFDTGLYFERRAHFVKAIAAYDPANWYNHFFEPLNRSGRSQDFWVNYLQCHTPPVYEDGQQRHAVTLFTRKTLQSIRRKAGRVPSFTALWHDCVRVRPQIRRRVEDFKKMHRFQGRTVLGLHFRGTDKFPSKAGTEDAPLHYEYGFCSGLLAAYIAEHQLTRDNAVIFIATDEQPFVEFMLANAGIHVPVCFTDSLRSGVSTSGLFMDTSACRLGVNDSSACAVYNKLVADSVHRGLPAESKYKKGEDVLVDVLLLCCSTVFFRSRGNVSNFVGYINPACTIVDMVAEYEK